MIFNKTVFKKLLKTAYKGAGLLVANKEGRIIIAGGWWVMTMEERVFTKEAKAALVECTGAIPVPGECWRSTSAGNQIEMPPDFINIDDPNLFNEVTSEKEWKKTVMTVDGLTAGVVRVYQRDNQAIAINEIVNSLLDPYQVVSGEDGDIDGPYSRKESQEMLYWYTADCSFAAMRIEFEKDKYQELLENIAKMEIPEATW